MGPYTDPISWDKLAVLKELAAISSKPLGSAQVRPLVSAIVESFHKTRLICESVGFQALDRIQFLLRVARVPG